MKDKGALLKARTKAGHIHDCLGSERIHDGHCLHQAHSLNHFAAHCRAAMTYRIIFYSSAELERHIRAEKLKRYSISAMVKPRV